MKLDYWMNINEVSNSELARAVGVDRSTIGRIRSGEATPLYATARKIERETGNKVTLKEMGLS